MPRESEPQDKGKGRARSVLDIAEGADAASAGVGAHVRGGAPLAAQTVPPLGMQQAGVNSAWESTQRQIGHGSSASQPPGFPTTAGAAQSRHVSVQPVSKSEQTCERLLSIQPQSFPFTELSDQSTMEPDAVPEQRSAPAGQDMDTTCISTLPEPPHSRQGLSEPGQLNDAKAST